MCDRLKKVLLKESPRLTSLSNGSILRQESMVTHGDDISEAAMIAGRASLERKVYQLLQAVCSF
jgi:hypothetical protein